MKDPYEVLGIEPSATDAQVKAAYRELVKQFHPDKYQNNPLADLAEEKMKDINVAYDSIVKMRSQGTSSGGYGQSGYGSQHGQYGGAQQGTYQRQGGYYQTKEPSELGKRIRQKIQMGDLKGAEVLMAELPEFDGEYYFLLGAMMYKQGFLDEARDAARTACQMDPKNMEYRQLYDSLEFQSTRGFHNYKSAGCNICDCCNICNCLMCSSCCCS